jgi:glycopeptide antibiotics resistance protein
MRISYPGFLLTLGCLTSAGLLPYIFSNQVSVLTNTDSGSLSNLIFSCFLADFAWSVGFSYTICFTAAARRLSNSWLIGNLTAAFALSCLLEFCQHLGLLPGTGDILDVCSYLSGFFSGFLLFSFQHSRKHQILSR